MSDPQYVTVEQLTDAIQRALDASLEASTEMARDILRQLGIDAVIEN
jgi:hypothetical protein